MALSSLKSHKIIGFLSVLVLMTACTKRGDHPADPFFLFGPEIQAANVETGDCLNVGKIVNYLNHPSFVYPGSVMTIDFHPVTDISGSQAQFYSYSTFFHKTGTINAMGILPRAEQDGSCSQIQMDTSTGEKLVYDITNHSANEITFRLNPKELDQNLPDHIHNSLKNRPQVYEYTVTYLSPTQLKIAEKYHAPDALCGNKRPVDLEVVKIVSWSRQVSGLPGSYEINPNYLSNVKNSLQTQPTLSAENVLSLADIHNVMSTPVRDEFKMCL
jgi:hypothetical protein